MLDPVADGIWTLAWPQKLFGLHIGTRMTVVRLDRGLLLHSPIPMTSESVGAIEALGEVRHIVCPNMFHHLHAGAACRRWPRAILHGPEALVRKRRDLPHLVALSDQGRAPWAGTLRSHAIRGTLLQETVFLHEETGVLITSDLVENFQRCSHLPTKAYLHATGLWKTVTWGRHLRVLYRDRDLARRDIDTLLEWPIEQVVLAHGDNLVDDAKSRLEHGLRWL